MWEPSQLSPKAEPVTKQVFFDCDGDGEVPSMNYGLGNGTDLGLELSIGRGLVKLNCRESHEIRNVFAFSFDTVDHFRFFFDFVQRFQFSKKKLQRILIIS